MGSNLTPPAVYLRHRFSFKSEDVKGNRVNGGIVHELLTDSNFSLTNWGLRFKFFLHFVVHYRF